jgi:hypothetical protein
VRKHNAILIGPEAAFGDGAGARGDLTGEDFMRRCLFVAVALMLLASPCLATDSDTQLWSEIHTTTMLNSNWDLVANGQLRFGDDISSLIQESMQMGFNLKVCDYLTISPTYRYINNDPADGSNSHENRAAVLGTVHFPLSGFHVSLGNEFEYRLRDPQTDSWRYRPRLTIEHPIGPSPWNLSAYLSGEGFYDSEHSRIVRNRAYAGFRKKLMQNLTLDLYYMRQDEYVTNPDDLNVVGIALRFHFNGAERDYRPVHSVD